MHELSQETKMIVASNLTIAAVIRDAAMAMRSGPQPTDSKDKVTQMFAAIMATLEKPSGITT